MSEIGRNQAIDVVSSTATEADELPVNDLPTEMRTEFLAARLQSLNGDNLALTAKIASEQHEKVRLHAAINRMQGENAALRQALDPAYYMGDEVAHLVGKIDAQSIRIEKLAASLNHLHELLDDQQHKLQHLSDVEEDATQHIANLLEQQQAVLQHLGDVDRDGTRRIIDLLTVQENGSTRNEAAERLDHLLNSTSWRLMRPLRGFRRLFSRRALK